MTTLYNLSYQKTTRRKLRNNNIKTEQIIWQYLKNRRFMNLKFRRQYGIGRYIVDFYCPALQLAIEIDGPTHYTDKKVQLADNTRQKHLEEHGIHILRFTNQQVYQHIDTVMNQIVKAVEGLRPQQKIQSQSIPQLKKKIEKISIPA